MKNKLQIVWSSIAIISVCACSTPYTQPDAPIKEVPFTQVHLDDNFWSPRIETNRTVSIPSASKNVKRTADLIVCHCGWSDERRASRRLFFRRYRSRYKIIEGASDSLAGKR